MALKLLDISKRSDKWSIVLFTVVTYRPYTLLGISYYPRRDSYPKREYRTVHICFLFFFSYLKKWDTAVGSKS